MNRPIDEPRKLRAAPSSSASASTAKTLSTLLLVIGVASLVMIPFTLWGGAIKAQQDREEYRDALDRDEPFDMDARHTKWKVASLPYFLLALAGASWTASWRGFSNSTRIVSAIIGVAALCMALWSLILSARASFDEVWPAWVVASVAIGAWAFVMWTKCRATATRKVA